jgi:hypothetical protein
VRSKGCTACLGLSGVDCKGTVRKCGSSLPIGGAARTDSSRSATSPTLRRPKRPRGCARRADASIRSASPPPMLLSPGHIGRNQVLVAEARKLRNTRPQGHLIACLSDHLLPHRVGRGIVVQALLLALTLYSPYCLENNRLPLHIMAPSRYFSLTHSACELQP